MRKIRIKTSQVSHLSPQPSALSSQPSSLPPQLSALKSPTSALSSPTLPCSNSQTNSATPCLKARIPLNGSYKGAAKYIGTLKIASPTRCIWANYISTSNATSAADGAKCSKSGIVCASRWSAPALNGKVQRFSPQLACVCPRYSARANVAAIRMQSNRSSCSMHWKIAKRSNILNTAGSVIPARAGSHSNAPSSPKSRKSGTPCMGKASITATFTSTTS